MPEPPVRLPVGPGQDKIAVLVIGAESVVVAVVVIVGGADRIAFPRHTGPDGQVFPQAVEHAGKGAHVHLSQSVVIAFHHGPEARVQPVGDTELFFDGVKLRRVQQDVPFLHPGQEQSQLGQGVGISVHAHVDGLAVGKSLFQQGRVIAVPP